MEKIKRAVLPLGAGILVAGAIGYLILSGNDFDAFVKEHGHQHHRAPHGGALIVLGMHDAHVELVLDSETGRLELYALDGQAKNAFSLPAEPIEIAIQTPEDGSWHQEYLMPDTGPRYRPTEEEALRFHGRIPELVGHEEFRIRLPRLTIAGRTYPGLTTRYPQGNE